MLPYILYEDFCQFFGIGRLLTWDEVRATMEFHQTADKEIPGYEVGDKVYLVTTNIKTKRPMKKLDDKKIGPFTITEKVSSHAYRLKLPSTMKIHNVFHVNLLSGYKDDSDFHRRQAQPPPVVTEEGEEEWEVEKLVGWEQKKKGGLRYQVRWKGYGLEEDTMERAEKMAEMAELMESFLTEYPDAPTPKNYKHPTAVIKEGGEECWNRHQLTATTTTTTTASSAPTPSFYKQ